MKNIKSIFKISMVLILPVTIAFIPLMIFAIGVSLITAVPFQDVCSTAMFWFAYIILVIGLFIGIGQELFD
jgi:hypothetical protein